MVTFFAKIFCSAKISHHGLLSKITLKFLLTIKNWLKNGCEYVIYDVKVFVNKK